MYKVNFLGSLCDEANAPRNILSCRIPLRMFYACSYERRMPLSMQILETYPQHKLVSEHSHGHFSAHKTTTSLKNILYFLLIFSKKFALIYQIDFTIFPSIPI